MIKNHRGPVVLRRFAKLSVTLLVCASALIYAQSPVPFISLPLVPDATPPGGADFTLTINGAGFVPGTAVNWNGAPLVTNYISGTRLTATVPAAEIANASTALVTAVNPTPGGGASNVTFFGVTPNQGTSVSFNVSSTYPVSCAYGVATGDFNGDGILDLAVASCTTSTISVFLGDGKGNFTLASTPSVGQQPVWVAVGDFNGDGKPDLAVANYYNNGILSVLLGDGTGNFSLASSPQTNASYPQAVVVGDFNGDGKLDLATADFYGAAVSILLGDGTGNFSPGVLFGGGTSPYSLVVDDFNQDGKLDLAVGNFGGGGVVVLMGDGTGNFNTSTTYSVWCEPLSVASGDLNGDGKPDIVSADDDCDVITPALGDGAGNFTVLPSVTLPDNDPFAIAAGDFNGDGKLDMVLANWRNQDGGASVFLGDGTGKLTVAASPSGDKFGQGVAVGDFNSDGLLDFAVGNGSGLEIFLQIPPAPTVALSTTTLAFATQLIGTASASQSVTLTNTGTGTLTISSITGSVNFTQTNNCGTSVAAGASCTITVTFQPKGTGVLTGTITINDNAANTPQTIAASGVGTAVTLLPSSLSFGGQTVGTTSKPKTATLTNYGKKTLRISGIHISGANPANFAQTNNCGTSLGAGAACTISVTFTPKTKGAKTATLTVADDGGASPQSVSLSGTGR